MRLFKSSEYAIRCLVYMAVHRDEVCSVKTLSESLDIPYKFLGRLMSSLRKAGIVEGLHGKNGGYVIAQPLEELHLADIIDVVEGLDSYDRCILGFDQCDEENPCPLHDRWKDQKDAIREMIDSTTLAELSRGKIHRL